MKLRDFPAIAKEAFDKWGRDRASRISAALAFYTALSLAPLLVVAVAVANLVIDNLQRFGDFAWIGAGQSPREAIVAQVAANISADAADLVRTALDSAADPTAGFVATALGVLTLLFSASGLFGQLQDAFNTIWQVPRAELKGLTNTLVTRLVSLGMVLTVGFLLLASLALSVVISLLSNFLTDLSPRLVGVLPLIDVIVSLLLVTLLFALIFRYVPKTDVRWRDVWLGAVVSAVLFIVGKFGLSYYLSQGSVGSAYGAAGSIVVLLVWVYYSGQIVLYGAELSYVYAQRFGSRRLSAAQLTPTMPPAAMPAVGAANDGGGDSAESDPPPVMSLIWTYTAAAAFFLIGIIVGAGEKRRYRKGK